MVMFILNGEKFNMESLKAQYLVHSFFTHVGMLYHPV
jgi:hypothetical protein